MSTQYYYCCKIKPKDRYDACRYVHDQRRQVKNFLDNISKSGKLDRFVNDSDPVSHVKKAGLNRPCNNGL